MCTGTIEAYSCGCTRFTLVQQCAEFQLGLSEHYHLDKMKRIGFPCSIHQYCDAPVREPTHPPTAASTVSSTTANPALANSATANSSTVSNLQEIAKRSLSSHISDITSEVVDRLISIEAKERNERKEAILAELLTQIQKGLDEIQDERDLNTDLDRATTRCWIRQVREGKRTLEDMEEGVLVVDDIGDSVRMEYVKVMEREILGAVMKAFESF